MNILIFIISILIAYILVITAIIIISAYQKPKSQKLTIVVLGCQVKGSSPSKSLKRRLDTALAFSNDNPETIFIVSGGKGDDEKISEAECMFNYLTKNGVSESRIIKEDTSTNTLSNLRNSKKIIQDFELPKDIVTITDFYHQLRVRIIARKLNIKICGTVSCIPSFKISMFFLLRECIAIPVEIFKKI